METLLHQMLKALKVPFTTEHIWETYNTEPQNDTLLGIKRMLAHYGIITKGVRIQREGLSSLAFPFIMSSGEHFFLINKVEDITDEILKEWKGIVLYVTDTDNASEPEYRKHRIEDVKRKLPFAVALVFQPLCALLFGTNPVLTLTAIVGLIFCYFLLQKQLGEGNEIGEKICSLFQKHGCDAVLKSDEAKVAGVVSLSEVGLGYFWSQLLFLGLAPQLSEGLMLIVVVGMCFPLWSIYSQWKLGKWCGMCLMVLLVLVVQGIYVLMSNSIVISIVPLGICGITIIVGISFAHLASEAISQRVKAVVESWRVRRFARKRDVFESLIAISTFHDILSTDITECRGNAEATNIVTIYVSHNCSHCKAIQPQIDEFLRLHGEDYYVQFVNIDDLTIEAKKDFRHRTGLIGTPAILLNGYMLPEINTLSDIPFVARK